MSLFTTILTVLLFTTYVANAVEIGDEVCMVGYIMDNCKLYLLLLLLLQYFVYRYLDITHLTVFYYSLYRERYATRSGWRDCIT